MGFADAGTEPGQHGDGGVVGMQDSAGQDMAADLLCQRRKQKHRLTDLIGPRRAVQFHALVNGRSGTSDAVIHSAFPIESRLLEEVVVALQKRFGRKLNASVVIDPELIGGIRVVVGDEVLDTSIKARLEQMKAALAA